MIFLPTMWNVIRLQTFTRTENSSFYSLGVFWGIFCCCCFLECILFYLQSAVWKKTSSFIYLFDVFNAMFRWVWGRRPAGATLSLFCLNRATNSGLLAKLCTKIKTTENTSPAPLVLMLNYQTVVTVSWLSDKHKKVLFLLSFGKDDSSYNLILQ